jgi:restriction system protein
MSPKSLRAMEPESTLVRRAGDYREEERVKDIPTEFLTWNDAAEKVLKAEAKPLNYRDLALRILKQKLLVTESRSPHITLYACMKTENASREERGIPPRFQIARGEVSLAEWSEPGSQAAIASQAKRSRDKAKEELLKRLMVLPGDKFETFIEALLISSGYQNVDVRGGSGDEGIDLLCEMAQGINQVRTAVQAKCKQAHKKVGPKDVRLLRDVLPKFQCSQGVLITTSGFTTDAKDAANEQGRLPIILIDGERLSELALEHGVGVRTFQVKSYAIDEDFELFHKDG